jgi:hypothetical protein
MYKSNEVPACFILQPRVAGNVNENTKFGLMFFDGNQLSNQTNPNDWTTNDKLFFKDFGHITKDGDKLVFSSHSEKRQNALNDSWKNGRILLSKNMIEAWAVNMAIHIEQHAAIYAPWTSIVSTHYHEIDAPNVYLRRQMNYKILGTNQYGMIIDTYDLILSELKTNVPNDFTLSEINIRKRNQKFSFLSDLQSLHAKEFGAVIPADKLKILRKALGYARLSGPIINRVLNDSNAFFLLDPVSMELDTTDNVYPPGLYLQGTFVDTQLPAIFNRTFNSSTFTGVEFLDVAMHENNGVAIGQMANGSDRYSCAYYLEGLVPNENNGNEATKPFVTKYSRIFDFDGLSRIEAIASSKYGYIMRCKNHQGNRLLLMPLSCRLDFRFMI